MYSLVLLESEIHARFISLALCRSIASSNTVILISYCRIHRLIRLKRLLDVTFFDSSTINSSIFAVTKSSPSSFSLMDKNLMAFSLTGSSPFIICVNIPCRAPL